MPHILNCFCHHYVCILFLISPLFLSNSSSSSPFVSVEPQKQSCTGWQQATPSKTRFMMAFYIVTQWKTFLNISRSYAFIFKKGNVLKGFI